MPTLTINANAQGVLTALRGVNSLIETAEASTQRLAAVSSTIAGHYQSASVAIREADRRAKELLSTTLGVARAASSASGAFTGGLGGFGGGSFGGRASAEFARARQEVERTARASQVVARAFREAARASSQIRAPQRGGGGLVPFAGPRIGPGGGGGAGVIDVSGSSRVIEGAGQAIGGGILKTLGSAARAFTQIGGTIAGGIGTALSVAGGPLLAIGSAVTSAFRGVTSLLSGVIGTAWNLAKPVIAGVVGTAILAGGFSLREAIASQPINNAFGSIAQERGLGTGPDVLNRLRTASQGTISDRQLQLNANQALFLGAAEDVEQIERLIEAGRRLGEAMGRTATEGFNDLAIGIGRQSRLILDNLGLIVRSEEATEAYAAAIGKTTSELTDQERRLAFQQAAYDAIETKLRSLGEEQDTAAKALSRLVASAANFGAQFAAPLLEGITDVANRWAKFLGDDLTPERLRGALSSLASGFSLGDGVFGTLSRDIFRALTDPSEEAFRVIGLRTEQYWDNFKTLIAATWDFFKARVADGLAFATQGLARIAPGALGDRLAETSSELASGASFLRRNASERIGENVQSQFDTDRRIENLIRFQESRLREPAGPEAFAGGSFRAGPGQFIDAFTGHIRGATSAVAAISEAKSEELFALEQTLPQYRSLIDVQSESVRVSQREVEARRANAESLQAAGADLARAQAGFGAFETIEQQASRLAQELRSLPDEFDAIGDEIGFAREDLARTIRESALAEKEAREELERSIRDSARDFLRGGPIEGQNVASRAAQRRFQREERRAQAAAINAAFSSSSLTSFGGNFGGFGAQNLDQRALTIDPRAVAAARGLESIEGDGRIGDAEATLRAIREENRQLIAEAREKLSETLAAELELLATYNERENEAAALQVEITRAIEEQNSVLRQAIERSRASETEIQRLRDQIRTLQVAVRRSA